MQQEYVSLQLFYLSIYIFKCKKRTADLQQGFLGREPYFVSVENLWSDVTEFSCGVLQGSVLRLCYSYYRSCHYTLLLVVLNYFPIICMQHFKPCEPDKLSILMDCLKAINSWMANYFLQLNADSTECLIFAAESNKP